MCIRDSQKIRAPLLNRAQQRRIIGLWRVKRLARNDGRSNAMLRRALERVGPFARRDHAAKLGRDIPRLHVIDQALQIAPAPGNQYTEFH